MKTKFSGILTLLLAFVVQLTFAQEKTISGTISDENGLPLPGVNIIVKGTTTGTQSDFDGNYSLTASTGDVLAYSFIGYTTKEMTVGSSNTISFSMEADSEALEEVVITALGIKRKQDEITTANQVVKSEELVKANNPNVLQSLSGKVTGLQVSQTNNGVSGDTRIVLRGNRSITGDNQALIVVDGAISTANFLSSIDPNTIESVNIIKGANGAALYGQQGSNGVIIVSTKRGTQNDKMVVSVKSSVDVSNVAFVPEQQTRYGQGWDYGHGTYENVTYENGAWGAEFDGQMVPVGLPQADGSYIMAPYSSRGADHVKDFFNSGHTYQNSVSISSGDDSGYFFLSANNEDTEFVIKNDILEKTTFNFKAGKTLGKWRIAGNTTYSYVKTEESYARDFNNSLYRQLLQVQSNVPIEAFENSGNEGSPNGYYTNPYWARDNQRRDQDFHRFSILGEAEYSINDNISALIRSNGLFTFANTLVKENAYTQSDFVTSIVGSDRSLPSFFSERNSVFSQYYTDVILNFDYELSDDFSLKANLGANNQYIKNSRVFVGGEQLSVPGLNNSGNLSAGYQLDETGNFRSAERSYGVYAQVDLGFRDYLFLNVTGRNDWSSVLSKDNNSFFYPSAGVAFIPTKAFSNLKGDVLNYAKISASYVKVGSKSNIAPYAIQEKFGQAPGFPFAGQNSFVAPTSLTDAVIEPEFTTSVEVGVNLGFLKNRITLDANYYSFSTDNQITGISSSRTSGLTSATVNLSETEGWGTEIDLGLVPVKNENVQWNIHLGFTKNYTEVVKVSDESNEVSLGGLTTVQSFAVAGEEFPVLKGTDYERDEQGRVIIGANGNPKQAAGLKTLGKVTPDYILNASTAVTYKGFTFAATMDYRTGHQFYSMAYNGMLFSGQTVESAQNGRGGFIYPNSVINTGTAANPVYTPNTNVPTGSTTGSFINYYGDRSDIASASVFDATAFKVREMSLSYDVSPKMLDQTFIKSVSLSLIGRNLITVLPGSNRGYNDPETSFGTNGNGAGIATFDQYPSTESYGFGVNLTF